MRRPTRGSVAVLAAAFTIGVLCGGAVVGLNLRAGTGATDATDADSSAVGARTADAGGSQAMGTDSPAEDGVGAVTLGFAGDIHFEGPLARRAVRGGLAAVRPLLAPQDLTVVNLETAVGRGGRMIPGKEYSFRTGPGAFTALAGAGVDAVALANNHSLDFGLSVGGQTLAAARRSGVAVAGLGSTLPRALAPARLDAGGQPVSIFSVATVEPFDDMPARQWAAAPGSGGIVLWPRHQGLLLDAVRAEAADGRLVVVMVHAGIEGRACPTATQKDVARDLSRAGARIIVGSHPHVLGPAGFDTRGALVAYSLGNFAWYNQSTIATAVLTVTVEGGRPVAFTVTPARIGADGMPRKATGALAAEVRRTVAPSACSGLRNQP